MGHRIRTTILAVLVAAGIGSLAYQGKANTINIGFDNVYYSDATFTTEVGERWETCNGRPTWVWGVWSQYVYSDQWDCNTQASVVDCPSGFYVCTCATDFPGSGGCCTCV